MRQFEIYVNGMQIASISDAHLRFHGEAEALVESLLESFVGKIERSFPWKDKEKEMISLFPRGDSFHKFLATNPERVH